MRSRLFRVNLLSLALALVLIAIGAAITRTPEERAEVSAAAQIARTYDKTLSAFLDKANGEIRKKAASSIGNSKTLLSFVDKRIADVPRVPTEGTTEYGREQSDAYRSAVARQKAVLQTYGSLATLLRDNAVPIESFLAAGKKLLLIKPGELLKGVPILSGWPLRQYVIPEYEKAEAALKKQKAPPGEDLLFKELKDFAKDTIKDAKAGAVKLDAGENFFFEFGELPNQLYRRLIVVDYTIKGTVVHKVEASTQGI